MVNFACIQFSSNLFWNSIQLILFCFGILEEPTIIDGPDSVVVSLNNTKEDPPSFTCEVGGAPQPTPIWTYSPAAQEEGVLILLESGEEYNVTSNTRREENGRFIVTSTVTFLSTKRTDGGIVSCRVGSRAEPVDAFFTVLGESRE